MIRFNGMVSTNTNGMVKSIRKPKKEKFNAFVSIPLRFFEISSQILRCNQFYPSRIYYIIITLKKPMKWAMIDASSGNFHFSVQSSFAYGWIISDRALELFAVPYWR